MSAWNAGSGFPRPGVRHNRPLLSLDSRPHEPVHSLQPVCGLSRLFSALSAGLSKARRIWDTVMGRARFYAGLAALAGFLERNLFWSPWLTRRGENVSGSNAPRHCMFSRSSVFGISRYRQIFFMSISSTEVFWWRAMFSAKARRIVRSCIRQQDGLPVAGHGPSCRQSRTDIRTSSPHGSLLPSDTRLFNDHLRSYMSSSDQEPGLMTTVDRPMAQRSQMLARTAPRGSVTD